MKKLIGIGFIAIFALSVFLGVMSDVTEARPVPPPTPCTYRCINQDWYLCCLYWFGPTSDPVEICTFEHYMCE